MKKISKIDLKINISNIPDNAIKVCKMLKYSGFQAYLVGGCVRDLIMGNIPKDWDIATNAQPNQTKKVFNSRDAGSKYPETFDSGIEFGTVTVKMGPNKDDHFEVTTYRVDGSYDNGRKPDKVDFVDNIERDLERRDLTINAMAYDPIEDRIIDPFGGISDLENKVVKAVGDPNARFSEDGLRTMRAARFAARFGFEMDPETKSAISNNIDVLKKVSVERIRDELLKTLETPSPSTGLKILEDTGALSVAIPNQQVFSKISNNINGSVIIDGLRAASLEAKISILFSDVPLPDVIAALTKLKLTNAQIKKVSFFIAALSELNNLSNITPASVRKLLAHIKNNSVDSYEKSLEQFLIVCDSVKSRNISDIKSFLSEPAISRKDLNISGNDIISSLNLKPGPEIKKILDKLYDSVLENPELNTAEKLLEMASKFEKVANILMSKIVKKSSNWWDATDDDKKKLLKKDYDFGEKFKFRPEDIPELASQVSVPAGPIIHHPEKNQLLHNNLVYDRAREISDDPMVWYGAAMHDLGKSFTDKSMWPKQHGHEDIGVPYAEKVSDFLGVPDDWKEFAKLVAGQHLKSHTAKELRPQTIKKLFELFNSDKDKFKKFLEACEADAKGRLGKENEPYDQKDYLLRMIESGFEDKNNKQGNISLGISAKELIDELGIPQGKKLGEIINYLKSEVKKDPLLNDKDILLQIARQQLL